MILLIQEDGTVTNHASFFDKCPPLSWLQQHVGPATRSNLIEVAADNKEFQLIVNEEGLLIGLKLNPLAGSLAEQKLVGPAILLTGKHRMK